MGNLSILVKGYLQVKPADFVRFEPETTEVQRSISRSHMYVKISNSSAFSFLIQCFNQVTSVTSKRALRIIVKISPGYGKFFCTLSFPENLDVKKLAAKFKN